MSEYVLFSSSTFKASTVVGQKENQLGRVGGGEGNLLITPQGASTIGELEVHFTSFLEIFSEKSILTC